MKNFISILAFLLIAGCSQPTTSPGWGSYKGVAHTIFIKNSKWETISSKVVYLDRSASARDALADAQTQADEHNAQTIQDFYRVYLDTVPDLTNAPPVTLYYCNPETNNVNSFYENIPRQMLVDRYDAFVQSAGAQVIYIDHVPPAPILDKNVNPYAWYCLTIVNTLSDGSQVIVHQDHCGFNPDQSWTPGSISDWPNVDAYLDSMITTWNLQMTMDNANGAANERMILNQAFVLPDPAP